MTGTISGTGRTYGANTLLTLSSPRDSVVGSTDSLFNSQRLVDAFTRDVLGREGRFGVPFVISGSCPSRPINFGTEGPKISRSNNPTRAGRPNFSPLVCCRLNARFAISHELSHSHSPSLSRIQGQVIKKQRWSGNRRRPEGRDWVLTCYGRFPDSAFT